MRRGTVTHAEPHPLAGKTVKLNSWAVDPVRGIVKEGADFQVEDWWDHMTGGSWMDADGNPTAIHFAFRTGMAAHVPCDDEVVYGHIGPFEHLVHASELGDPA